MRCLALVALIAACAHTPDLPLRPESPAPAGQEVGEFAGSDGTKLWRRHWLPTAPVKGVLIIQHGLRDHSDNYDRFARKAAAAGFSVWAMDLRGHARSAGPRVDPDPWQQYVDDMDVLVSHVAATEPGQPIFLFGHSMGGAIVALEAIEHREKIAGVILSAAVLNLGVPPLTVASVKLLGVIAPSLGVMKLDPATFSRNPAVGEAMPKDPLVEQGAGPASTAAGLADATQRIFDGADRLTLPVLALHGTADQLTAPSGSRALIEHAAATDKTLRIYDGLAHDLVHEPEGEQVEADVLAWLGAHTGGPAVETPAVYSGALRGDPAGTLAGVMIGGGVLGDDAAFGDTASGFFELGVHLGRGRPVGWAGGLGLRAAGAGFAGYLAPLGLGIRFGGGTWGIATGASLVPGKNFAVPIACWFELPLGPVHATIDGRLDYRIGGDPPRDGFLSTDYGELGLAIRAFGDKRVWPRAFAGVGPYVRAAIVDVEGEAGVAASIGLQLFGAD